MNKAARKTASAKKTAPRKRGPEGGEPQKEETIASRALKMQQTFGQDSLAGVAGWYARFVAAGRKAHTAGKPAAQKQLDAAQLYEFMSYAEPPVMVLLAAFRALPAEDVAAGTITIWSQTPEVKDVIGGLLDYQAELAEELARLAAA